jgi:hypothetical protein
MSVGIFGQCLYSGPHLSGLPYLGRLDPAFAMQAVIQYQDRPLGTCGGIGADFTRSSSFIIPWMSHVHIPAVWQLTATLYHTAELRVSHWYRVYWSEEEDNNNKRLITVTWWRSPWSIWHSHHFPMLLCTIPCLRLVLMFYQQQSASFFVNFFLFHYCASFRFRGKETFIPNSSNWITKKKEEKRNSRMNPEMGLQMSASGGYWLYALVLLGLPLKLWIFPKFEKLCDSKEHFPFFVASQWNYR